MSILTNSNNILSKKIIRDFAIPLTLTTCLVLGIIWLTKVISIIDLISSKGVSLYKFFSLTMMILPELIFYVIPFAVIISFYIFFQNYFFTREVYILRNIPVTPKILLKPVKQVIFFLLFIQFINGFLIAPFTYKAFDQLKFDIKFNFISVVVSPGTIEHLRNDLVSYVDNVSEDNILNNFFIYRHSRDNQEFLLSKKANIVNNGNDISLNITDGILYRVNNEGKTNIIEFGYYSDDLSVMRTEKKTDKIHYKEISFFDLINDISSGQKYDNLVYAGILFKLFWILLPLIICIMAREIYFYGEFRRNGLGKKHLLFWIVSISCVTVSLAIKNVAASNQTAAIYIVLLSLIITYVVSRANFSEKI
ncbi:MAG: LptF/LptG family permease [Rickettsiales bacterium]|jgi:lipopolysaccharide export LptBFGC system permease protein LptF|nr:LptF/LptG family permease [Rickettsiales bacterium]